jgi:hypothetical protein
MKKIFFLFALLLVIATSCATHKNLTPDPSPKARGAEQLPAYLSGNNEAIASNCWIAEPEYFTDDDQPVASSGIVFYSGEQ